MPESLELYVENPAGREMPKSELAKVFNLGIEMIQKSPKLSEMIVADQDAVALEKKKPRQLEIREALIFCEMEYHASFVKLFNCNLHDTADYSSLFYGTSKNTTFIANGSQKRISFWHGR